MVGRSPRCYCSFAYSAAACFRMGMSGRRLFQMLTNPDTPHENLGAAGGFLFHSLDYF
jgi:hypothetical protein